MVSSSLSELENVKISTLYSKKDKMIILQFEDSRGPVFRSWFRPADLREVCYSILDQIQQVDLDED